MNQLLLEIGISKSTFYNLFESKLELQYFAFIKDRIDVTAFYDSIHQKEDPVYVIEQVVRHVYTQLEQLSPTIVFDTLVDSIRLSHETDFTSIFNRNPYYTVLTDIIDSAILSGRFKPTLSVGEFINLLFQTTLGILTLWGQSGGSFVLSDEVVKNTVLLVELVYLNKT